MEKQLSVAKFGGTSVGDIDAIEKCIDIICNNKDIKIVVVSAQSGVTNLLEKLIASNENCYESLINKLHQTIDPIVDRAQNRESLYIESLFEELELSCQKLYKESLDRFKLEAQILSFGERASAFLFNEILNKKGISSIHVDAREIIKTNNSYKKARPLLEVIKDQAEKHLINHQKIIVLEGFIGSNLNNEVTVLGRGGSDYSAALIAEATRASLLYIWTDVTGIHQADPRVIPDSKVIKTINFKEAIALTSFGAKVLHPDTLWPIMRSKAKVFVGSTFSPNQGGTLIEREIESKHNAIRAVTELNSQVLIKIKFSNYNVSDTLYGIFAVLRKYDINSDIVNLTETSLSFVISQVTEKVENLILENLKSLDNIKLEVERNLALTTIIGNNLDKIPKLLSKVAKYISTSDVRLSGYGAGGSSLYLLTNQTSALDKVYRALF